MERVYQDADLSAVLAELAGEETEENKPGVPCGYSCVRPGIRSGRALMTSTTSNAKRLIMRLKDSEGRLREEIGFWAAQLASLARNMDGPWDAVTCPPSSGKRSYSLAEQLAGMTARCLDMPFFPCFVNPTPRGNRQNMVRKLQEEAEYEFHPPIPLKTLLVVDDYFCTGMTALRCVRAALLVDCTFLVIGKS